MSGRGNRVNSCITAVVDFMIRFPGAKVLEAMLAKKFTLAESSNLAKRMAVRRAYKEVMKKWDAASCSREIVLSLPSKTISPLTSDTGTAVVTFGGNSTSSQPASTPTTPGSRSSPRLTKQRPKLHLTWKNVRAMQKHRVNKLANSILPLYPETRGRKGHRLPLKCNSGPGRLQVELLAQLRFLGVYLYPGVPNTTAVTQETDRTYGLFKSKYRANLEDLVWVSVA